MILVGYSLLEGLVKCFVVENSAMNGLKIGNGKL